MINKSVLLCGFMGCGKTTIGKLLSSEWNRPFYDTDSMIEAFAQQKIDTIFVQYGEQYFRELEYKVAQSLHLYKNAVISSGGGFIISKKNAELAKESCFIIYLNRDFDLLWTILSKSNDRPLLKSRTKDEIYSLYLERDKIYTAFADLKIENNKSPKSCINRIGQIVKIS